MEYINWPIPLNDKKLQQIIAMRFNLKSEQEKHDSAVDNYWIENFRSVIEKHKLHGSFDYCFENTAYKTRNLFIDTKEIRDIEKILISLAESGIKDPALVEYQDFGINIIVGHLLLRNYTNIKSILEFAKERTNTISNCIETYKYNICINRIFVIYKQIIQY